ncbi:multiple epidermal growth factor-like domains 10 [Elysia marginata]|uniref:Multiple epidermal growth factor-like domains 10 n=1 Tax=Elysia marginata TaxID=1093978 RepID=A0AAV4FXJ3_9GAST|nr:multiple epidermal growth factor-like domains 10 [Elysia marginata]
MFRCIPNICIAIVMLMFTHAKILPVTAECETHILKGNFPVGPVNLECHPGCFITIQRAVYDQRRNQTEDFALTSFIREQCDAKNECSFHVNTIRDAPSSTNERVTLMYHCRQPVTRITYVPESLKPVSHNAYTARKTQDRIWRTGSLNSGPRITYNLTHRTEPIIRAFPCERCQLQNECSFTTDDPRLDGACVGSNQSMVVDYVCRQPELVIAYESETVPVECGRGEYINIVSSWYGSRSTECGRKVTAIVKSQCVQANECFFKPNNHVLSDPCTGQKKYLRVDYFCTPSCPRGKWGYPHCDADCRSSCSDGKCDPEEGFCYECREDQSMHLCFEAQSVLQEEAQPLSLGCQDGTVLHIISARYGLSIDGCLGENRTAVVKEMCEREDKCYFNITNQVLGDACVGNMKKFRVNYICLPRCEEGKYGENCANTCSDHCGGQDKPCDHVTGVCLLGCRPGYSGQLCDTPCHNTFGRNCARKCSESCKDSGAMSKCDPINGTCTSGCLTGYHGDLCDKVCMAGTFGAGCANKCSDRCSGIPKLCNPGNGGCLFGCIVGYSGYQCDKPCNNTYGERCSRKCSDTCKDSGAMSRCYPFNGTCTSGCLPGYHGDFCENECMDGTFGENCTTTCSEHCEGSGKVCHHETGVCLQGCQIGYSGDLCDRTCNSSYGLNCEKPCNETCLDTEEQSKCDPVNGTCTDGCEPGYRGDFCQEACVNRTYGENCEMTCSIFCAGTGETCSPVNGSCYYGCRNDFVGDLCIALPSTEAYGHYSFFLPALLIVVGVVGLAIVLLMEIEEEPKPAGVEQAARDPIEDVFFLDEPRSPDVASLAQQSFLTVSTVVKSSTIVSSTPEVDVSVTPSNDYY